MSRLHVLDHPLSAHHVAALRDVETTPAEFRAHLSRLVTLLAYEATRDLATREVSVRTPLQSTSGRVVSSTIGLAPILRAGLGMVDPLLSLLPEAQVWHLGFFRDEQTAEPVEYYNKLPPGKPVDVACVLDPMLATGGSATQALRALTEWGVPTIKLLAIIASRPGIERLEREFPETSIYVCAVDPELNDRKFIVPGLGDAGDRAFGTIG